MTTQARWVLWIIGVLAAIVLALYIWISINAVILELRQEAVQKDYASVDALLDLPPAQMPIETLKQALGFAANWEKARADIKDAQEQMGYSRWTVRARRLKQAKGWTVSWISHGIIPGWVGTFEFSNQGEPLEGRPGIWSWTYLK